MAKTKRIAIFLADAGMELCWLFAWAGFLLSAMKYKLSLPVVVGIFGSGCVVSVLERPIQRPISSVALRVTAFLVLYSLLMQMVLKASFQGWPLAWLSALREEPRSAEAWLFLILFTTVSLGIYWRGLLKPGRCANGENINSRFDMGLGAFFLLFVIRTALTGKGFSIPGYPHLSMLFIQYFLFSLFAIGLIRTRHTAERFSGPGFYRIFTVLVFSCAILAIAGIIAGLFRSHLTSGADRFLITLKSGGEVVVSTFISTLFFIRKHRSDSPTSLRSSQDLGPHSPQPEAGASQATPVVTTGEDIGLVEQILGYSALGLALTGMVLLIGALTWVVLRHILRKREKTHADATLPQMLKEFFRHVLQYLQDLKSRIPQWFRVCRSGMEIYAALKIWGRRSGIEPRQTDTPLEYGNRLTRSFPGFKMEVDLIVELVNQEIFAENVLTRNQLTSGLKAGKEMRKLKHWPLRLKTWLFFSGGSQVA